jgi:hypothetical protein
MCLQRAVLPFTRRMLDIRACVLGPHGTTIADAAQMPSKLYHYALFRHDDRKAQLRHVEYYSSQAHI